MICKWFRMKAAMNKQVEDGISKSIKNKLAIVVGHEAKRPGADSVAPLSMSEYNYNTDIARSLLAEARQQGLNAQIFFRDKVGIRGVYRAVNKWIGKTSGCAIELHFNSANGRASGTETLFDLDPPESMELARQVQNEMVKVFGLRDRGIKKKVKGDRGYYNLEQCKVAGVIVEPFFGDNPSDASRGKRLQNEYCKSLLSAVVKYFETRGA